MKCSRAQRLMSDYLDGLLKESKAQEIERHILRCTNCSDLFGEMKALVQEARNLEKVEPSEDVWLSIENQMTSKNRKPHSLQQEIRSFLSSFRIHQGYAIASAALVAIMVFSFLLFHGLPYSDEESYGSAQYALHHFEEAEKHYQLAIKALVRSMPDYKTKISPELAGVFRENLAIIDNSIGICEAAIQKHPGDKTANALLMACYKKKLELLNEIRDITMRAG